MNYQILGQLTNNDGVYDEETGEVITEPTLLQGFHVNTTEVIEGADEYRVSPTVPRVVYAGVETFFYCFPDEDTFRTFIPAVEEEWIDD